MSTKRPTTRAGRIAKRKAAALPGAWEPKFLDKSDQRYEVIKLIRRRLERLKTEAGCDSIQKELLANEAVFISVQLETMRVDAIEGKSFEAGKYALLVNALSGILSKLKLHKQAAQVLDLDAYVASKAKARTG